MTCNVGYFLADLVIIGSARGGRRRHSGPTYARGVNVLHTMLEHGRRRLHQTTREFAKFGLIGAINTFVDLGLWNLFNMLVPGAEVKTKIAASLIATTSAYLLNRYWAFRHRKRQQVRRETVLFLLFNGVGLAIQVGAITLAKYGFDTTDTVTLNIASIIGLIIATGFRFWSYRRWIWLRSAPEVPGGTRAPDESDSAPSDSVPDSNDSRTELASAQT
ncbi:MAG: GtrA family protein [Mycobacteriales bacterium]